MLIGSIAMTEDTLGYVVGTDRAATILRKSDGSEKTVLTSSVTEIANPYSIALLVYTKILEKAK